MSQGALTPALHTEELLSFTSVTERCNNVKLRGPALCLMNNHTECICGLKDRHKHGF